jgi:pimeloyl-ACP methyl ester carboxylesterase
VQRAVVVSHSLGSAYASYLLKQKPHLLKALTLIDPVAAMMHHPKIVGAFVYKPVTSPLVAVEEYFVRRELFVANVIARHLHWHEAALWPTSFNAKTPTLIVLSEEDAIVPSAQVQRSVRSLAARARGVRVLTLPGFRHGGWIASADASRLIGERVKRQYAAPSRIQSAPER